MFENVSSDSPSFNKWITPGYKVKFFQILIVGYEYTC